MASVLRINSPATPLNDTQNCCRSIDQHHVIQNCSPASANAITIGQIFRSRQPAAKNTPSKNSTLAYTTQENSDSIDVHPEVYVQSMAGLRAHLRVEIPQSILDKVNDGITINKAELIITVADDPTESSFVRPATLRVYNARLDGKNEFVADLLLGEAYYGGKFDSKTSSYRFNLGRHLQQILHPDPALRIANTGLFLVITDERISATRLVLKNGTVEGGMKMVITYTPLK